MTFKVITQEDILQAAAKVPGLEIRVSSATPSRAGNKKKASKAVVVSDIVGLSRSISLGSCVRLVLRAST